MKYVVFGFSDLYVIMIWIIYILIMVNVNFVWNNSNFLKVELMWSFDLDFLSRI